jgi:hypothetical protein
LFTGIDFFMFSVYRKSRLREASLAHEPDNEIEDELRRHFRSERKRSKAIVVVPVLLLIGIAAAFLWRYYGDNLEALSSLTSSTASRVGSPELPDKPVGLKDFEAFQQQTGQQIQAATQQLESQQAELKLLSDQTAALTAKIDALAQPAPAAPVPVQTPPAQPATAQPTKKKPVPKLTPGISVGGAPLPIVPKPEGR